MSIFSLGWARNWKKYKYEMKKMNNEKNKKLKKIGRIFPRLIDVSDISKLKDWPQQQ